MYLYRAIDSLGDTVEFYFSENRDLVAAKSFHRKALARHGQSEHIVIDGSQTNHEAILSCDAENRLRQRSRRPLQLIRIRKSGVSQQSDRTGSQAYPAPRSIHARLQVAGRRSGTPLRHR